jgi:hypothetical protein
MTESKGEIMRDESGGRPKLVKKVRAAESPNSLPKYVDKMPQNNRNLNLVKHLLKGD